MGLCQVCLSLDFASIMETDPSEQYRVMEGYNKLFTYTPNDVTITYPGKPFTPYHKNLDALGKSSGTCELCSLLHPSISTTISKLRNGSQTNRLASYELFLAGLKGAQGLQVIAYDNGEQSQRLICWLVGGIGFVVDTENPLAAIINGRTPPLSPKSTMSIRNINEWLLKCSRLHEHPQMSTLHPTRLLKYHKTSQKVILCDSFLPPVKYAALSYCWGSMQPLTLNAKTTKHLYTGVSMEDLPRTFQDAFWLASELQIPYLWIDSLCILQDDPEDWVRESSQMGDIYGNAYLTIAAARAKNSYEGFLGLRSEPTSITIPLRAKGIFGEVTACLLPYKLVAEPARVMDMEDAPLSKRAWVIQERYLSPRTLHFADSQTYFECNLCFTTEDCCCTRMHPFEGEYAIGISSALDIEERHTRAWRYIVERYTRRCMTLEGDKLPAISGLAARFAINTPSKGGQLVADDTYLAGLWKGDLLRGMCWEIDYHYPLGDSPSTYQAPSWSWASVKSAIDYGSSWFDDIEDLAIVKNAKVDPSSKGNDFGKVTGGWVHLSVIELRPYQKDRKHFLWFREAETVFRITVKWDSARFGQPDYDYLAESIDHKDLVAIPLGSVRRLISPSNNPDFLMGPFFLILVPAQTDSSLIPGMAQFQRVGFGVALGLPDQELDKLGVARLVRERFLREKEKGKLQDILIL